MRSFAAVTARFFAAALAVASLAPVANAQNASSFSATVKVPFAFETAMGQHFQAGTYTIRSVGAQSMVISNRSTRGVVLCQPSNEGMTVSKGKAVFTHYGDRYYLRSLTVADSSTKMLFSASKQEKEAQIASGQKSSTVELASLQDGR